jgi:hypothetical protein
MAMPHFVQSQSLPSLHAHLTASFDRIGECYRLSRQERTIPGKTEAYIDSLNMASEELRSYLMRTLPLIPESISDTMAVPEGLWVNTSADKNFRAWSWDTKTGGEKPKIVMLFEFATPNGLAVVDSRLNGATDYAPDWYDTIYAIQSLNGVPFYMPLVNSQFTASDVAQRVDAFVINAGKLTSPPAFFRTANGPTHSIEIKYNYFKNYSEKLGRELQTVTVPIVVGDSVTSGVQRYEFEGTRYVLRPGK